MWIDTQMKLITSYWIFLNNIKLGLWNFPGCNNFFTLCWLLIVFLTSRCLILSSLVINSICFIWQSVHTNISPRHQTWLFAWCCKHWKFVRRTGVGNGSKLAIRRGPICVEIKKNIYIYIQDRILKWFFDLHCIVLMGWSLLP